MSSLHSLVYVSTAATPFSPEDLTALLDRSRERNRGAGISGMLLYKDGCFMQAIEGEALSVQQLHKRIVCDPRHGNLVTLLDGPITRREFPDWTMGFHRIEQDNLPSQPGFNHMLRTLLRHNAFSLDPALAKRLLLSFTTQPV